MWGGRYLNAEGEWWVDGDGAVSGACERREEEVVDEERPSTTQWTLRPVMCDAWTRTGGRVRQQGVEACVGQQPQSGADTRGFNSVMSEASGWVPMRAYLVARRVSEKEECLVRTLRNWQISFSPR